MKVLHRFYVQSPNRTRQTLLYEINLAFITPTILKHVRITFLSKFIVKTAGNIFHVRRLIKQKDKRYKKGYRTEWITVYEEHIPLFGSQ